MFNFAMGNVMEIWNAWMAFIESGISVFYTQFGLSEAMAVVLFTALARVVLMPVSLKAAVTMHKNKVALSKVRPEIERIKDVYKRSPEEIAKRTMAIYKRAGIKFIDKNTVMNIGSQSVLGLGVFQTLQSMVFNSKFMWIANIAKPDLILAIIVGVLTSLSMLMMPYGADHSTLMLVLPALVSVGVLISFPSVLGIYWATSNIVTIGQGILLRLVIARSEKATSMG